MLVSRFLSTALVLLSAAGLLIAQGHAQESAAPSASDAESSPGETRTAPPPSSQIVDEIQVRGRRMEEIEFDLQRYIMDFVLEVTTAPPGRGYARWQDRLCVGVHNLETTAAQYLVDRISQAALDVGLEPGEPGCNPQVIIIFTTDAQSAATQMVESDPRLFRPAFGEAGMNLSRAALDDFKNSERPVRWWHVSMPVDARTGLPAMRRPEDDGPPVISVAGPSRIYSGVRDDLQRAFVVVDATLLSGTTWQQLADYLAMVSLAQIDPNAKPGEFDSILNLFESPQYYSGLTDWDRSYLHALYTFDQERLPQLQRGGLVGSMLRHEQRAED
jgi:hypothetical protein